MRSHQTPVQLVLRILVLTLFPSAAVAQNASVVATEVIEREVNIGHRVVGTVMPIQKSTVGTAVDGRVVKYLVNVGDHVQENQPLAKLRTGTLEIELNAARAELKLRQEELRELQNGSRPEEISEAKARMLAAQAIRKHSLTRLQRLQQLFERQAVNETELDNAKEQSEAASYSLQALEATLQRIEAGPRVETIAQAQARVDLQESQMELIEDRIRKFTIFAPFEGYITAEHTAVGEWVSSADPIAEVIALNWVEVLSNVPAEQAVRLKRGVEVRVEFQELPGEFFTGSVERVVPIADNRTRTFPVNILLQNRFEDDYPVLMAGMLARAVLPTGNQTIMPLVSKDALVLNGSRRCVFVVNPGASRSQQVVRSVPVSLGVAVAGLVQVDGDLKAGDLVVVRGNERLTDGQDVTMTIAKLPEQVVAE